MWGSTVPAALKRPRLWGALVVCASVGLIARLTLWPFDFSCRDPWLRLGHLLLQLGVGKSSVSDVLLNAALFIPFGFGLASVLPGRRWRTGWTSLVVVFGSCFAVSYTIEALQQCLPARYPAWRDVLANSFGGVLGWSGLHSRAWRRRGPCREDGRT
jgi:VanZ like family